MLFSVTCWLFSSLVLRCWCTTVCAPMKPSFGVSCCLPSACPIPLGDPIRLYLTIFLCWVVLSSSTLWQHLHFGNLILVQDLGENLCHLLFPLEYQIRWQHWESEVFFHGASDLHIELAENPLFLWYSSSAKKNIPFYNVLLWLKNYLLRSHSQYLSHQTSISSHFRTFKEESRKEKPGVGIQLLLQLLATRADCFDPSCDEMSLSSSAQQLVPGRRQLGWRHPRGPGAVCEVVADCDVPPCDGLWHATLALLWLLGTYTNVPQRRAHLFLKEEIHSKSH